MSAWREAYDWVASCLRAGVTEYVVCGGARNAVLLEALARAEKAGLARVWGHFEERSAGFFALGRIMETGLPCAVVTTSGTAAAELLPAVVEGFYQARPLVAVTADRPVRFRGTGAPQAIEQERLFGSYAVAGRLADWDGRGPLHLNVPLEEDFEPGEDSFEGMEAGDFKARWERPAVAGLARWLREEQWRGLVVLLGGLEPDEREEVFHFCRALDVPVHADATSGLREALGRWVLPDGDRWLRAKVPGKVLRLGDVPSGRFWRDLEGLEQVSVWSVCRSGLSGLARPSGVVCGRVDRVLQALGEVGPVGDVLDFMQGRGRRADRINELLETYPDSEPGLVRALSQDAAMGGGVYLGNSMPVREWNLFAQWRQPMPLVRANRGANGIDGQLSSWLGWSAGVEGAWAVVGDLTVLYDVAGLGMLGQVECRGRTLVVVNNGGGRIFDRLPRLGSMQTRAVEWLRAGQQVDFAGMAAMWGMQHVRVRTADDLDGRCENDARAVLMEVLPDEAQTRQFWAAWDRMAAGGG